MKIKSVQIENFRSFANQTVSLNDYCCLVGPNGAGKSTVLAALNVFFQEQDCSVTDTKSLCDEDFFRRKTETPIRITVTFRDLGAEATAELSDYVRHDELVVTAEAKYEVKRRQAEVRYFGKRLGMEEFRAFFEAEKGKAGAAELNDLYSTLRQQFTELPRVRSIRDKIEALREYESERPAACVLISSEDQFYGYNGTGKLAPYVQWVYVPAVKDAKDEGLQAKHTAIGKLIDRAVKGTSDFDEQLKALRDKTLEEYSTLLKENREGLNQLASSLQTRVRAWAHPNVQIGLDWLTDPSKSVQVNQPVANLKTGDGDFVGELSRMGHGLQRSYLLALLQELAASDAANPQTLVLGCEEPELYQHPPQARHLADVLRQLANGGSQVVLTTHSPLFVSGEGFEDTRLVKAGNNGAGSTVSAASFAELCTAIREARGEDPERKIEGLVAKIHQALRPHVAELFFATVPVLVEGLEDASYITAALHLAGKWDEFRRLGCHIVPVNGKDKLIQPIAIAKLLSIPCYVVFDADSDTTRNDHRIRHEKDNKAILGLLESDLPFFPESDQIKANFAVWSESLTKVVESDFGQDCAQYKEAARKHYANEGGLEKNDLFIADFLEAAHSDGKQCAVLTDLCDSILEHARQQTVSQTAEDHQDV